MKVPPRDRELWEFHHVLDWHLRRGTRPGGSPKLPGQRWTNGRFAKMVGDLSDRTVRDWRDGRRPPNETNFAGIESALFGSTSDYRDWVVELRNAFETARARHTRGPEEMPSSRTNTKLSDQTSQDSAPRSIRNSSEQHHQGDGRIVTLAEALIAVVERAERAQVVSRITGVATGFTDIDSLLSGLQQGDLIILAARPGMGATALATNISFNAARIYAADVAEESENPRGAKVLYFSLDGHAHLLAARILSEQTSIPSWKIRNGIFTEEEWEKFVLTMNDIQSLPVSISDFNRMTIRQIEDYSRDQRRAGIGLIVVDAIQQIAPSSGPPDEKRDFSAETKALKHLARELDVPIVAVSHLPNLVDEREDKRPLQSDLDAYGSIRYDADVIMLIYREEYYLKMNEPEPGTREYANWLERAERTHKMADIIVEKNRHGASNVISLIFDDRFVRFQNVAS